MHNSRDLIGLAAMVYEPLYHAWLNNFLPLKKGASLDGGGGGGGGLNRGFTVFCIDNQSESSLSEV